MLLEREREREGGREGERGEYHGGLISHLYRSDPWGGGRSGGGGCIFILSLVCFFMFLILTVHFNSL